jgi:GntR family transcriptional regulator, transcriptional repressor for pyruvate dehydrogenase complex
MIRPGQRAVGSLRTPLRKGSVVSSVLDRFREALLCKDLKPGDYLPSETELCKNLGVGKSSLREAVKMLQAMGVVEVRRGQGTRVREQPGIDYISPMVFQLIMEGGYPSDLVDLRLMFEPAFSVMAMRRATEEDRARIRTAVEGLESSVRAGTQAAEKDIAFHLAILHATKNPLVIRIGETLFQLFKPSIAVSMQQIPERAILDHRRVFEAFLSGDETRLREAVVQSYEGWKVSLFAKPAGANLDPPERA